jgi:hypothetical protein
MSNYEPCLPWKNKGEYPIDNEGVLYVSPYWKKALALAEKRRKQKVHLGDVIILTIVFSVILYFIKGYS